MANQGWVFQPSRYWAQTQIQSNISGALTTMVCGRFHLGWPNVVYRKLPNVASTLVFSLNSFECCFHNSSCFGWWNLCFETSWKHVDLFFLFRTHFISWRSTSEGFSFPADSPLNQPRAVGRVDVKAETQKYWKLVVAFYSVPHVWLETLDKTFHPNGPMSSISQP